MSNDNHYKKILEAYPDLRKTNAISIRTTEMKSSQRLCRGL